MSNVLLQVSDWNYQDKYYELSFGLLEEFAAKIKAEGIKAAWQWFVDLVYDQKAATRVDEAANHTLDEYFLDYNDPLVFVESFLREEVI